ncbi:family 43 glycosylhydrolase [Massilia sp. YIM B02763]|uniref:family 43 glycosylhydrolase n=1 Tax=Massilia sp. YIM B02763 TaxID=3050130 RepID=UPI0025B708F1|nr:family 43 glycosylhydrolase [Massilia sp. YIM B02763]MDN4054026.1 family 43 glycosylhydrolase [Massilia sp. YIM B02763]
MPRFPLAGLAALALATAFAPAAGQAPRPAPSTAATAGSSAAGPAAPAPATTYRNPLSVRLASGEPAENCADPAVMRDPNAEAPTWYLYCTSDPVSKRERPRPGEQGDWHFRMMPIYRSTDLVHWNFVADAFEERPAGLAAGASGLWAPEPTVMNGRYYLYFTVTDVADAHSPEPGCDRDSAIGVATSSSPTGPWQAETRPVVAPRRAGPGCNFLWTYDPKVVTDDAGRHWLYYGSYGGGIWVVRLDARGMRAQGKPVRVGADERYEGAEVIRHGGWWYLFASATDCCAGPLTGYVVYVGRARSPTGPFRDRLGYDMAARRAGGSPVLVQNGNRWVGGGHNTVFTDMAGQWWTIYHAVDVNAPYFSAKDKLTKRAALLDRIDWVDGWPLAGGGAAPTDTEEAAPAVAPGTLAAEVHPKAEDVLAATGAPLWADSLRGPRLDPRWRWLRPPAKGAWSLGPAGLALSTQDADLYVDTNSASVLRAALPDGDLRIEVEMALDAPDDCCARPVQAGIVLMRDDDNYVKLVELARGGLRQVEFGKELAPVEPGYPRYGNTVAGTPGTKTWLRLDIRRGPGGERYTAFSSQDGRRWTGGATWNHKLGPDARLGLVAMGGAGWTATFSRVAVYRLSR